MGAWSAGPELSQVMTAGQLPGVQPCGGSLSLEAVPGGRAGGGVLWKYTPLHSSPGWTSGPLLFPLPLSDVARPEGSWELGSC